MKSFLTYVVLVGVPIAGLFGILHAGSGLRAPRAIGGEWRITAGPLAGSTFVVQQSGEHLSVVLPTGRGTQLRGKSRGDTLDLSRPGLAVAHSSVCGPERGTAMRAVLDFSTSPVRMHGVVGGEGCPSLAIEAARVPPAARTGGGH